MAEQKEGLEKVAEVAHAAEEIARTAASEAKHEAKASAPSALLLGAAAGMVLLGVTAGLVAAEISLARRTGVGHWVFTAGMLGSGALLGFMGWAALPREPMPRTRRLVRDRLLSFAQKLS